MRPVLLAVAIGFAAAACGHDTTAGGARQITVGGGTGGPPVTQAELQQDIERFSAQFTDRVAEAMIKLEKSVPPERKLLVQRQLLLYASNALAIATGELPEVNLLDMIVFVRLCRLAVVGYWIPKVYGEGPGTRELHDAFSKSETELWQLSGKVLTADQKGKLVGLINRWRAENPHQMRVEGVRLLEFTRRAGAVAQQRAQETGGLMSSVKQATQAADKALLLAERGMFLVHRMPFLLRLQARLATNEILTDAVTQLTSSKELIAEVEKLMPEVSKLMPMMRELPGLAKNSIRAAHEVRLLISEVRPLLPSPEMANKLLHSIDTMSQITMRTESMVRMLRGSAGEAQAAIETAKKQVHEILGRALLYLVILGGAWAAMLWGGYFIVKRVLARRAAPHAHPSPGGGSPVGPYFVRGAHPHRGGKG